MSQGRNRSLTVAARSNEQAVGSEGTGDRSLTGCPLGPALPIHASPESCAVAYNSYHAYARDSGQWPPRLPAPRAHGDRPGRRPPNSASPETSERRFPVPFAARLRTRKEERLVG